AVPLVQLPGRQAPVRLRQGRRPPHPVPPPRTQPLSGRRVLGLAPRLFALCVRLPAGFPGAAGPLLPGRRIPAPAGPRSPEGRLFRGRLLLRMRTGAALGGRLPRRLTLRTAGGTAASPPDL